MKLKHLLITVITLISFSASAQITKGSVFLGGQLGFHTNKNDNYHSSGFGISPAVGIAVKENLVAGVDLLFNQSKTDNGGSVGEVKNLAVGGGVFLRKYAPLGKGFYLFGQGRVGANLTKNDYTNDLTGPDGKGFNIQAGIYPGIAYSVNPKLQLEVGLPDVLNISYNQTKYDATPNRTSFKSTGFSASTSVSASTNFLSVGVRLFIAK
jgi:hypothetical protein